MGGWIDGWMGYIVQHELIVIADQSVTFLTYL